MLSLAVSKTRMGVYRLLVGADDGNQYNLSQAASRLNLSVTTVYMHKQALQKAGHVVPMIGTHFYSRGPNAKYIEELGPLNYIGPTEPPADPPQHAEAASLAPPSPAPSPPPKPTALRTTARVETIRAHMNGSMMFKVDKIGDLEFLACKRADQQQMVCFLDGKQDTYKGSKWTLGRLQLPGEPWACTVKLQETRTQAFFYVWPPEVNLTMDEIRKDPEARQYPQKFFEKEVFDILNFIERWGGWKFNRVEGRVIGRVIGQVEYGYTNPELNRTIPPEFSTVRGSGTWVDASPGEKEIESHHIDNITALVTAGEHFKDHDKKLDDLDAALRMQRDELKLRLIELYGEMNQLAEVIQKNLELSSAATKVKDLKDSGMAYR